MAGVKPLVPGEIVSLNGSVTQNKWVGARSAGWLEENLGFAPGRLAQGWKVLLLKATLGPDDFELDGTTLRSGGRFGLPANTWEADKERGRVHDDIVRDYGSKGYADLQRYALKSITPKGENRLVKVVPVIPHDDSIPPDRQYPMGGGGLQWKLKKCFDFLVAMTVDQNGIAVIASDPPFSASLARSVRYDDRQKIRIFLDEA